jgi:hypothetical protein
VHTHLSMNKAPGRKAASTILKFSIAFDSTKVATYPKKSLVRSAPTKLVVIPVKTEIMPHLWSDRAER